VEGNIFSYQVSEIDQLNPADTEKMEEESEESPWDLTLFTCTLGGSFRVTVRCTAMEQ
jgi:sortase A